MHDGKNILCSTVGDKGPKKLGCMFLLVCRFTPTLNSELKGKVSRGF